ncbi:response regulator receiver domain protein [Marvinbryantia formatexigens DSM 14469]|uniref:Stage 0 sporulation protein A homolog n=1 Tax=Marvinbryantia formatexigens DSM 14469 TaxID=478749 RepID=C6L8Z1_9FIRM|nr:response regulator receiver domain protein [Marvinbryantia formatexigens DSM 14469]
MTTGADREGTDLKLLVVEDELYAREALVRKIRQYDTAGDFQILEASNGKEGFGLYRQEQPELVITDIRMPGMDGLELLENIRQLGQKTQVVILSAYSEFAYAQKAIQYGVSDYLLKPVSDEALENCLDKFMQRHKKERGEALITGKDMVTRLLAAGIREENTTGFVERSMFRKIFPSWQIVAVYFERGRPEKEEFLAEIEKIYGSSFWTRARFLELKTDFWILLFTAEQENVFLLRKIRSRISREEDKVYMGVSRIHRSENEVHDAYQEALNALKTKVYTEETLLFAETAEPDTAAEYYLRAEKEEQLRSALAKGREKTACSVIEEAFQEIKQAGRIKISCLEQVYYHILLSCQQEIGIEKEDYGLAGMSAGILKFRSPEEIRDYLCRVAGEICRLKRNEKEESHTEIVKRMTDYAEQHYFENVTVKDLAEHVLYMNPDYLSHIFAEKKGINFSTYLQQVRIEHAKELLEKGTCSVTETALLVGYNDVSRFIRVFKQETGMTPKKYCSLKEEDGDESGGKRSAGDDAEELDKRKGKSAL